MTYLNLRIGDTIPDTGPRRGIVGDALPAPRWHALKVAPCQEEKAVTRLAGAGVEATYPKEERHRFVNGKKVTTKHPAITQIVYAKFRHAPRWHVLKERRIITGVISRDCCPIILSPDTVSIIMGLPTEAERLAAEREERMRVYPGERVELVNGLMAGFFVDVAHSADGRVFWEYVAGAVPIRGESARADVRKVGE